MKQLFCLVVLVCMVGFLASCDDSPSLSETTVVKFPQPKVTNTAGSKKEFDDNLHVKFITEKGYTYGKIQMGVKRQIKAFLKNKNKLYEIVGVTTHSNGDYLISAEIYYRYLYRKK